MLNPNKPCETCAFGKAVGAAGEVNNRLAGEICALSGVPFGCHHAPDGRELNWRHGALEFMKSLVNGKRDLRVCAGWKREVAKYAKQGLYKKNRGIRMALGRYALDQLQIFLSRKVDPVEKEEARMELEKTLHQLVRRRNEYAINCTIDKSA